MSTATPTFFFTAGEHSGDALGAALIAALREKFPAAKFVGVGGPKMLAAGCEIISDPTSRSTMLFGVVKQTFYWWKLLRRIRREFREKKPPVVHVPIDSSTINLRIAHAAKQAGIPVCYYVAPQVWASRPKRVKKIARDVNMLCCVYPFEESYFIDRGVNAVYVGHSMFDTAPKTLGGRPAGDIVNVALLPGSRKTEIADNLPVMLSAAQKIRDMIPQAQFVVAAPSEDRASQIRARLGGQNVVTDVRVGEADAVLAWADVAMVKSGTGVLQAAKFNVPMVVVYKLARWKLWLAKKIVTTKFISLVNILSGRPVVREFIGPVNADEVAGEVMSLIEGEKREKMKTDLAELVAALQPREGKTAAQRVAAEVAKCVDL